MLSQHEADTLAEALAVLDALKRAGKAEGTNSSAKVDEAFYLGRFAASCWIAEKVVRDVLSDAASLLDDEKARDVLGAE